MEILWGGCCDSRNGGACCDDRDLRKKGEEARLQSMKAQNCGVGVLFSVTEDGALTVAALVPGSPAEASNLVRVGDILHKVDDRDVYCKTPQEVHRLVMGREGTSVKLSFKMDGCNGLVHVPLARRPVGAAERRQVVSQVAALKELSKARKGYSTVPPLGDVTNTASANRASTTATGAAASPTVKNDSPQPNASTTAVGPAPRDAAHDDGPPPKTPAKRLGAQV